MRRGSGDINNLVEALRRVVTERPGSSSRGPDDMIPRYIMDSIEPWDPAKSDLPIRDYLEIVDDFTAGLTDQQKMILLRMKLRGEAQSFLVDHPHLRDGPNPYTTTKTALVGWFDREDLNAVMRKLMTARLGESEGLREFAERVRRLARDSVRKEFPSITLQQQSTAAADRARAAFVKGLPLALARPLLATAPPTLEEALRRAEDMKNIGLDPATDLEEWRLSVVKSFEPRRCFHCRETGHLAANCPHREVGRPRDHSPSSGTRFRDGGSNRPTRPCLFCKQVNHFPINCPFIPECDLCGHKGHQEDDCEHVVLGRKQSEKKSEPHPNFTERATLVPQRVPANRDLTGVLEETAQPHGGLTAHSK